MPRRNLGSTRLTQSDVANTLGLIDDASQHLTDQGLLPFAYLVPYYGDSNLVLATPDTATARKGSASFRTLTATDIPSLDASKITTGRLALTRGGTHADLSATGGASQFLSQASVGADITVVRPATSDLSDLTTWTTPGFSAGDYTSDVGTWVVGSGDVTSLRYYIIGKRMVVSFYLDATTTTGTPGTLRIAIPAGKTAGAPMFCSNVYINEAGTIVQGAWMLTGAGATVISIGKLSGAAFGTLTDTLYVRGIADFEIQ